MICSISGRVALAFSPITDDVDRHLAPAVDGVAEAQDLALDDGAAALLRAEVGARQEDHADREPARAAARGRLRSICVVEEVLRRSGHGCRRRRRSCRRHRPRRGARPPSAPRSPRRTTSRRGLPSIAATQADAAGVVLVGRVVEAVLARRCARSRCQRATNSAPFSCSLIVVPHAASASAAAPRACAEVGVDAARRRRGRRGSPRPRARRRARCRRRRTRRRRLVIMVRESIVERAPAA